MAKVASTWIDNSKLRKELYDFNQAVKSVYMGYNYVDGIVTPIDLDAIHNPQMFMNSLFVRPEGHWEFINKCSVDPNALNNALKGKGYIHEVDKGVHYLHKEGEKEKKEWWRVGNEMAPSDIADTTSYSGIVNFRDLEQHSPIAEYALTEKQIEDVIGYQMLDEVIATDRGVNVNLLIGKEILPMVKRTKDIVIHTYKHTSKDMKGVYTIRISSTLPTWTFYSIHRLLVF